MPAARRFNPQEITVLTIAQIPPSTFFGIVGISSSLYYRGADSVIWMAVGFDLADRHDSHGFIDADFEGDALELRTDPGVEKIGIGRRDQSEDRTAAIGHDGLNVPYIYAPIADFNGRVWKCQGISGMASDLASHSILVVREQLPTATLVVLPHYFGDRVIKLRNGGWVRYDARNRGHSAQHLTLIAERGVC